jgi:hypothetical protein
MKLSKLVNSELILKGYWKQVNDLLRDDLGFRKQTLKPS